METLKITVVGKDLFKLVEQKMELAGINTVNTVSTGMLGNLTTLTIFCEIDQSEVIEKRKKFMKEVKRGLNSTKPQELLDLYNKTSSMVKKELTIEEKDQYKDLYKKKTESSSQKEWKDLDDRQREIGYSVAKRILGESGDVKVITLNINDKKSPYYAKDWIDEIIKDEVRKEIPRQ